jgi:hypothetical protein
MLGLRCRSLRRRKAFDDDDALLRLLWIEMRI